MQAVKRNTVQKQLIEDIVLSSCDHPSAETIYIRAREEMPAISLGTVYRVLKELASQGVVREISLPSQSSRFDKTTCVHAHFVCRRCGKVADIGYEPVDFCALSTGSENSIDEADIVFKGVCRDCKEEI